MQFLDLVSTLSHVEPLLFQKNDNTQKKCTTTMEMATNKGSNDKQVDGFNMFQPIPKLKAKRALG
jgi:hypothetical protein